MTIQKTVFQDEVIYFDLRGPSFFSKNLLGYRNKQEKIILSYSLDGIDFSSFFSFELFIFNKLIDQSNFSFSIHSPQGGLLRRDFMTIIWCVPNRSHSENPTEKKLSKIMTKNMKQRYKENV